MKIAEITDELVIRKIQRMIEPMVEKPSDFNLEWLDNHRWAAVPVPDSINLVEAEWIAEAANSVGVEECFAITTELEGEPICFRVPMDRDSVLQADFDLALMNAMIVPDGAGFAVLRESSYYYLVAGETALVRRAVGCSFETAREMYRDYAVGFEKEKDWLVGVADRYETYNGRG